MLTYGKDALTALSLFVAQVLQGGGILLDSNILKILWSA